MVAFRTDKLLQDSIIRLLSFIQEVHYWIKIEMISYKKPFCPCIRNIFMSPCYDDPPCHQFHEVTAGASCRECATWLNIHFHLLYQLSDLRSPAFLQSQVSITDHLHFLHLDPPVYHHWHHACCAYYESLIPNVASPIFAWHLQYSAPSFYTCTQQLCLRDLHSSRKPSQFPCSSGFSYSFSLS